PRINVAGRKPIRLVKRSVFRASTGTRRTNSLRAETGLYCQSRRYSCSSPPIRTCRDTLRYRWMSYNRLLVMAIGLSLEVLDASCEVLDVVALFYIGLVTVCQGKTNAENHDETPNDDENEAEPGEPRHVSHSEHVKCKLRYMPV